MRLVFDLLVLNVDDAAADHHGYSFVCSWFSLACLSEEIVTNGE